MSADLLLVELYKGDDPLMIRRRGQLAEIARTPGIVTVLIEGEPETGKTTMARELAMARVLSMVDRDFHCISVERAVRELDGLPGTHSDQMNPYARNDTMTPRRLRQQGQRQRKEVGRPARTALKA